MPATLKPSAAPKRPLSRSKASAPKPASPVSLGSMSNAVEATVELGLIQPSPHNPRKRFCDAALQSLGQSMKTDGQMQNVTVRRPKTAGGMHVLIGGERRYRAAMLVGLRELRCLVVDVDDATAVRLCGIENYEREQLDPLEEASWFRDMLGPGGIASQSALAAELRISQPKISQRLDLLKLPAAWQQEIITAAIPLRWARHLTSWSHRPQVLVAAADQWLKLTHELEESGEERACFHLEQCISIAVDDCATKVTGSIGKGWQHWNHDPPSAAEAKEMDAIPHDGVWYAFDAEKADAYVARKLAAIEARRKSNVAGSSDAKGVENVEPDDPEATEKDRAAKRADMLARKLSAHREQWFRDQVREHWPVTGADVMLLLLHVAMRGGTSGNASAWQAEVYQRAGLAKPYGDHWRPETLAPLLEAEGGQLQILAKAACGAFLAQGEVVRDCQTQSPFRATEIEQLAARAGVSLAKDWRPDMFFLSLYDRVSLEALAVEWKLEVPEGLKTPELRDAVLDRALAAKSGPPKALLAAKPQG